MSINANNHAGYVLACSVIDNLHQKLGVNLLPIFMSYSLTDEEKCKQQGERAGSPTVTLTQAEMPTHTHSLTGASVKVKNPGYIDVPVNTEGGDGNSKIPTNILSADGAASSFTDSPANDKYSGGSLPVQGMQIEVSGTQIGTAGGSQPFPIMQPYLGLYYCIALEGIYPQRP